MMAMKNRGRQKRSAKAIAGTIALACVSLHAFGDVTVNASIDCVFKKTRNQQMNTVKVLASAIVALSIQANGSTSTVTASRGYVDRKTAVHEVTNEYGVVGYFIGSNSNQVFASTNFVGGGGSGVRVRTDRITDGTNTIDAAGNVYSLRSVLTTNYYNSTFGKMTLTAMERPDSDGAGGYANWYGGGASLYVMSGTWALQAGDEYFQGPVAPFDSQSITINGMTFERAVELVPTETNFVGRLALTNDLFEAIEKLEDMGTVNASRWLVSDVPGRENVSAEMFWELKDSVEKIEANTNTVVKYAGGSVIKYPIVGELGLDNPIEEIENAIEIDIGSAVTGIGTEAFRYAIRLEKVEIPSSVTSIGTKAFTNLVLLSDVTIEEGVKNIGNEAFRECTGIFRITIPSSVTNIGDRAFHSCENLYELTIKEGVKNIGMLAFFQCKKLESFSLPRSLESIGDSAFNSCASLEAIEIPTGVESVGMFAFMDCLNMTSVTIHPGVKTMGYLAFNNCQSLEDVTFEGRTIEEVMTIPDPAGTNYYPWGIKQGAIRTRNVATKEWTTDNFVAKSELESPTNVYSKAETDALLAGKRGMDDLSYIVDTWFVTGPGGARFALKRQPSPPDNYWIGEFNGTEFALLYTVGVDEWTFGTADEHSSASGDGSETFLEFTFTGGVEYSLTKADSLALSSQLDGKFDATGGVVNGKFTVRVPSGEELGFTYGDVPYTAQRAGLSGKYVPTGSSEPLTFWMSAEALYSSLSSVPSKVNRSEVYVIVTNVVTNAIAGISLPSNIVDMAGIVTWNDKVASNIVVGGITGQDPAGDSSISFGGTSGNERVGNFSAVFGTQNSVGTYSAVFGYDNSVLDGGSAFGGQNEVDFFGLAFGTANKVGASGVSFGTSSRVGDASYSFGMNNVVASGTFVSGMSNVSTGDFNFVLGRVNRSLGDSVVMLGSGHLVTEQGEMGFAAGHSSSVSNRGAFVWNYEPSSDSSFQISQIAALPKYGSHGEGTFNINPLGGPEGVWIGGSNMTAHVEAIMKKPLSGQVFDFSDMRGLYLAMSNVVYALGGSITNFPQFNQ